MKTPQIICLFLLVCSNLAVVGPVNADAEKQVQAAITLVDLLADKQFETAAKTFNKKMAKALPVDKLAEVWKTLETQYGEYEKHDSPWVEKVQQYDVVFVPCRFEKGVLQAKVVLDSELKVGGLFFAPAK